MQGKGPTYCAIIPPLIFSNFELDISCVIPCDLVDQHARDPITPEEFSLSSGCRPSAPKTWSSGCISATQPQTLVPGMCLMKECGCFWERPCFANRFGWMSAWSCWASLTPLLQGLLNLSSSYTLGPRGWRHCTFHFPEPRQLDHFLCCCCKVSRPRVAVLLPPTPSPWPNPLFQYLDFKYRSEQETRLRY